MVVTAGTGGRRDYCPDFRLKESGVYIEHFGVRRRTTSDGAEWLTTAPFVDCKEYRGLLHNPNATRSRSADVHLYPADRLPNFKVESSSRHRIVCLWGPMWRGQKLQSSKLSRQQLH
jgi:hypothetical protein